MPGTTDLTTAEGQKQAVLVFRDRFRRMQNDSKLSMLEQQQATTRDPGVKSPLVVARDTLAAPPEPDLRDSLHRTAHALASDDETLTLPEYATALPIEWLGYVPDASTPASQTQQHNYHQLTSAARHPLVILYLHGGGFCLSSAASCRNHVGALCRASGGVACAVNYRLSPQVEAPAHVLDVLVTYLSLLSPPQGSLHAPIAPSRIVLAGDSSGGGLALSVLQALLRIRAQHPAGHLAFHGRAAPLALPAGIATLSASADFTVSLPSKLPSAVSSDFITGGAPWLRASYPRDSVWPATPPRGEVICATNALAHPLISPATAPDWAGAPPLWIAMGTESCADSGRVVARAAAAQGVPATFVEYAGMPHCFAYLLPKLPQAQACIRDCAAAMSGFVDGRAGAVYETVQLGALQRVRAPIESVTALTPADARWYIRREIAFRGDWVFTGESGMPLSRL